MAAPTRRRHRSAKVDMSATTRSEGASTMEITAVGLDLAKNVFQFHGVDERSKVVLRRQLCFSSPATSNS